jgi:hypothetical protein
MIRATVVFPVPPLPLNGEEAHETSDLGLDPGKADKDIELLHERRE